MAKKSIFKEDMETIYLCGKIVFWIGGLLILLPIMKSMGLLWLWLVIAVCVIG